MAKLGVLSISPYSICEPMPLKKHYLMFDKIYIDNESLRDPKNFFSYEDELNQSLRPEDIPQKKYSYYLHQNYNSNTFLRNIEEIEALEKIGFLEIVNFRQELIEFTQNEIASSLSAVLDGYSFQKTNDPRKVIEEHPNLISRLFSVLKKEKDEEESHPLLLNMSSKMNIDKEVQALNFILSSIPEPDDSVSWKQLNDFKCDPDTMRKYYALIKWMNDISRKQFTLNEIETEFKFLYHDYANQYRIHKMKHKLGVIEIFVTAALDVLSGTIGVGSINTSLFSIWKQNLNLLEAETKFIGREVAYIYKANETFKR